MYMSLNEENSGNMQNKVKINKYACSSRQIFFKKQKKAEYNSTVKNRKQGEWV